MSAKIHVHILNTRFDPWSEVQKHGAAYLEDGRYGAMVLFVGTMRDFNQGTEVSSMDIEHYHGMTEKYITGAVKKAMGSHDVEDVFVIHRVGKVRPGDPIVMVAVWAAHRRDAYAVNRFLVEELKSKAPFWKKESLLDSERWVAEESNAT